MALPDPDTAYRLLREASGPSPWWCHAPIRSALGSLTWKKVTEPPGFNVLLDSEGLPRLGLPMYVWFRVLDEGRMLLWSREQRAEQVPPAPIVVQLINVDHLRRLADLEEWLAQRPPPVDPHFLIAPEFQARVEISAAYEPGAHDLSLPSPFDRVPEFFVVAENPALPKAAGTASFCIYAVDPAARRIEVFPQDWFNDGTPDYGYQWITCATRDSATRRLLVSGFRIDNFILDETGRRIEKRLPR